MVKFITATAPLLVPSFCIIVPLLVPSFYVSHFFVAMTKFLVKAT